MKITEYGITIAAIAQLAAGKLTPAKRSPALHAKDVSPRPRNNLEARSYDYCGLSSYYCLDATCCGTTWYHCMPSDAECCASDVASGEGLWCASGTSCTVSGGYVMCEDSSGETFSAGSTAYGSPSSSGGSDASQTPGSSTNSGGSSSSRKKTKKSKAWIAAAVIVPLIGVAIIAGVVFFLCMLRKKKSANAAASAAVASNYQSGQPAMTTAPPPAPMPPASQQPMQGAQNPDLKTPAYTYQHEVPTPVSSPPPQWTPAGPPSTNVSPAPTNISPVPMNSSPATVPPPQTTNGSYNMGPANTVSPMNTGNTVYAPQPVYGNAMELHGQQAAPAPRGGAHEIGG